MIHMQVLRVKETQLIMSNPDENMEDFKPRGRHLDLLQSIEAPVRSQSAASDRKFHLSITKQRRPSHKAKANAASNLDLNPRLAKDQTPISRFTREEIKVELLDRKYASFDLFDPGPTFWRTETNQLESWGPTIAFIKHLFPLFTVQIGHELLKELWLT